MFLFDAHCDTISAMLEKGKGLRDFDGHLTAEKLGCVDDAAQFFAVWLPDGSVPNAFSETMKAIEYFKCELNRQEVTGRAKRFNLVTDGEGAAAGIGTGEASALLAVEGGEALEGRMDNLHTLYGAGVRLMTLTWNRPNALGESSAGKDGRGLTAFGKDVVREMNALGMLVDVSHLSAEGFWDVADICQKPFIASHSNCLHLCGHRRNLSDSQIVAIGQSGGVIGINFYPPFLNESGSAGIDDVLRHIDRVIELAGKDAVGLGSDFDGIEATPEGLEDASCWLVLYGRLATEYGREMADGIFGLNMLRLVKETLR